MEAIEKITVSCFVLGMALLLLWFFPCTLAGDWMYRIHAKWFDVTEHEVAVIHYSGLMFTKILVFLFLLLPYIACKTSGRR